MVRDSSFGTRAGCRKLWSWAAFWVAQRFQRCDNCSPMSTALAVGVI
jgi:hypothetical protein